jgi:hypothetical protein
MRYGMNDPDRLDVMIVAREGAGFAGPFGMGVPVAARLLKDREASGKTAAALLLATDHLAESLDDKREEVQFGAAAALVRLRRPKGRGVK